MTKSDWRRHPAVRRLDELHVLAVTVLCAAALVSGAFDRPASRWWPWALLWLMLMAVTSDAYARFKGRGRGRPFFVYEGPVLWMVLSLVWTRLTGGPSGEMQAIAAGVAGWLFATTPSEVRLPVLATAFFTEVGLTLAGRLTAGELSVHVLLYALACFAFSRLGSYQRWMVETAQAQARAAAEAEHAGKAYDFGVHTRQAEALPRLPSLDEPQRAGLGRQVVDFVELSIGMQLEGLRQALGLQTAAVLWHNRDLAELHLRGLSSSRTDVQKGPFAPGVGVPASIVRGELLELQVAPVRAGHHGLPYYAEGAAGGGAAIGALMVVSIPHRLGSTEAQDEGIDGVLCVDRTSTERFDDAARAAIRVCARKIALDVACGRILKQTDQDRITLGRIVVVMRELNAVLGVEHVARAATKAVSALFNVDLVAVSLVDATDASLLRIVHADGPDGGQFENLQFTLEEGLTGQAVQKRCALPHGGDYRGVQPVFTASDRLGDLRSLTALPLAPHEVDGTRELGGVIGALTIGSREPGLFTPQTQKILELIASSLAVKMDLALAHEKLGELATQDGLTGLATRRVFSERIEVMLQRAERAEGPMALILTDIDHFKRINDSYGHPFGDQVLRSVARVIQRAVRKVDLAGRYGGEEFVVLLDGSTEEGAVQLAERLRREVEALEFESGGRPVRVTMSLGIAAFPRDGAVAADLTEHADKALYRAKDTGRNRTVTYAEARAHLAEAAAAPR